MAGFVIWPNWAVRQKLSLRNLRKFSQLFWTFSKSWDKIKTKERNVKKLSVRSESIQILKLKRNATFLRMCLVGNRNSKELPKPKREIFVCKKWRVRLKNHIKRWFDPFDSEVRICLFNYVIVFLSMSCSPYRFFQRVYFDWLENSWNHVSDLSSNSKGIV